MAAQFGSDSFPLEFNFIDNPIIVHADSAYFEFPTESVFRQVVIRVDATPTYSGASTYTGYFYADASQGTDLYIDVSTALRAAMNAWYPDVNEVLAATDEYEYPYATFSVTLSEKYLYEGGVYETAGASRTDAKAYYGGWSEYERLIYTDIPADYYANPDHIRYVTRKPNKKQEDAEMMETGSYFTYSRFYEGKMRTKPYLLDSTTEGRFGLYGSRYFYQSAVSGNRKLFAFVGSLGVIETIMGEMRESLSYGIESETKTLATSPGFRAKPNLTTHKTGSRARYEMSSGVVNRRWADWWTTEFLMAKRYWMLQDSGVWLPATVTPADDSVTVYNRSEQNLLHVDFDVEVAVSGSISNKAWK